MKNNSLIKSLALAPALALGLLGACAHDDKTSTADNHNLALKPLPERADGANDHNLAARAPTKAVAAAPVAAPVAPAPVVAAPTDRCIPSILSSGAIGKPCLTTAEFIASLSISPKEKALALRMVQAVDQSLAH